MPAFIQKIRLNIVSRLADAVTGFNAKFAAACTDYGIPVLPDVDFTAGSATFFQGDIDVGLLERESVDQYPLVKLYFESAEPADAKERSKPREFDGSVTMVVDVFLAFSFSEQPADFQSHSDAVMEALVHAFNSNAAQAGWQQSSCVYNADLRFEAVPMQLTNKNQLWLVGTHAIMSFRSLV